MRSSIRLSIQPALRSVNALLAFVLFCMPVMVFISGCSSKPAPAPSDTPLPEDLGWREFPLKDVRSGESFRVADFDRKWILIDLMAVWCLNCLLQQQQIQIASAAWSDDEVVIISLDMEPKETEFVLRQHAEKYHIDWRSAITSPEMVSRMIAELGDIVLFVSATPLILINPQGETQLVGRGLKPSKVLQELVEVNR